VDIQQSSADLLTLRRALASGGVAQSEAEVRLTLEDGSEYEHEGIVEFADVAVSESTGTVTLRARFPNPDGLLLPGMFVRARFAQGMAQDAFLAPQVSLTRAQGQALVWVIDEDETAQRRPVVADRVHGDSWVVTEGLAAGDRVIVEGVGKVTPGAPVRACPAGAPAGPGPVAGAPGAASPAVN